MKFTTSCVFSLFSIAIASIGESSADSPNPLKTRLDDANPSNHIGRDPQYLSSGFDILARRDTRLLLHARYEAILESETLERRQRKKRKAKSPEELQREEEQMKADERNAKELAVQDHNREIKANEKSAHERIKEVNGIGKKLDKQTAKQVKKNDRAIRKIEKDIKKIEEALKVAGKDTEKATKLSKQLEEKKKISLEKARREGDKAVDKLVQDADGEVEGAKRRMFEDWQRNNKAEWKMHEDGIAMATKHPSKAQEVLAKLKTAFSWLGTALTMIIPGVGPVVAAAATAAKVAAQVGVKAVQAGVKHGLKKEAGKAAKNKDKSGQGDAKDSEVSTDSRNPDGQDGPAGSETNQMKDEVAEQRNKLVGDMDKAMDKAMANARANAHRNGAKVRRALEDLGIWDEYVGVALWRRQMLSG